MNESFDPPLAHSAQYAYDAQQDDEVSVQEGDIVYVDQVFADGWAHVQCDDGASGMIPFSFLAPVEQIVHMEPYEDELATGWSQGTAPMTVIEPQRPQVTAAAAPPPHPAPTGQQVAHMAPQSPLLAEIDRLRMEQGISDEDIWNGSDVLYALLFQFRKELWRYCKAADRVHTITFRFPQLWNVPDQQLAVNPLSPVSAVAAQLAERTGIGGDGSALSVRTVNGCLLRHTMPMACYGLGSLVEGAWTLDVFVDDRRGGGDEESDGALAQQLGVSLMPESTEQILEFLLPPLSELNGLQQKTLKVDICRSAGDVLEFVFRKLRITSENSDRFCLVLPETSQVCAVCGDGESEAPPDAGGVSGLMMRDDAPLVLYGIGTKLKGKVKLLVAYRKLAVGAHRKDTYFSQYRFAQLRSVHISCAEAHAMIAYLDSTCGLQQRELEKLYAKCARLEGRAGRRKQQRPSGSAETSSQSSSRTGRKSRQRSLKKSPRGGVRRGAPPTVGGSSTQLLAVDDLLKPPALRKPPGM